MFKLMFFATIFIVVLSFQLQATKNIYGFTKPLAFPI
jgi:hypothetical protein